MADETQQQEAERVRMLFGSTGSGKTHLMRKFLESEWRCFLFDMTDDDKFNDWGVGVETCEDAVILASRTPKFRIKLHMDDVHQFDFMCKVAGLMGPCCMAVDEMSFFMSPQWAPEHLKTIIRLGRKRRPNLGINGRVAFVGTSQRPPDCHSLLMSQAKQWYVFQTHMPRDIQFFRQFIPNPERLVNQQRGEYLLWSPSNSIAPTVTRPTPVPKKDDSLSPPFETSSDPSTTE